MKKNSLRSYSLCRGIDSVATINSNSFRLKLAVPSFRKQQQQQQRRVSDVSDGTVDEFSARSPSLISSYTNSIMFSSEDDHDLSPPPPPPLTLEEMLAQVEEDEEEESAAAQLAELMALSNNCGRRMSCVNNSDILRAAKNALNTQHPRFSVDGRDVAHRPSIEFSLLDLARKPSDVKKTSMGRENSVCDRSKLPQGFREPCLLERLMGLESMPLRPPCNKSSLAKGSVNGYNDREYMVKQKKPCKSLSHQRLLSDHASLKSGVNNVFGSDQKNRIRKQAFGQVYSAASSSSSTSYSYSYNQSKKVQASFSSSKARELLMKKQNYCTLAMKLDDKKKEKKSARV